MLNLAFAGFYGVYMDYSTDPCYSEFTPGQAERMAGFFVEFRQQ